MSILQARVSNIAGFGSREAGKLASYKVGVLTPLLDMDKSMLTRPRGYKTQNLLNDKIFRRGLDGATRHGRAMHIMKLGRGIHCVVSAFG